MLTMAGALIALIVAAVCGYVIPHYPLVWQISLGIAIAAFLGYLFLDRQSLSSSLSKRTTRYGLVALVMSVIGMGIAVFSNLIVANHDWRKDFTQSQAHSLSEQSKKVLSNLKSDLVFKAFVAPNQKGGFEEFFSRYQYGSKNVKVDFVDVFRQPELVREYKISASDGMNFTTVVIESGGRTARVESIAGPNDPRFEEKLTNGIIKVLKGGQRKVYFLVGHVEKPLSKQTTDGLQRLKTVMEGSRYETQEFSLTKQEAIPTDAEIMVVAGPRSQFFPHELKLLTEYVEKGGKLLLMVDPESSPELKDFLVKFGVDWNPKRTVFELNPLKQANAPIVPVVDVYDTNHEITKNFNAPSFFIMASSVEKSKTAPADLKLTSLFSTSQASFEQEIKPGARISPQTALRKGPLSLAVAVSGPVKIAVKAPETDKANPEAKKPDEPPAKTKDFRVVVVGDSDFVTNQALAQGVNSDLFLNMMSWLAEEEDLISIRPKGNDVRELDMTEGKFRFVLLATLILLPFMSFATAVVVRIARRKR